MRVEDTALARALAPGTLAGLLADLFGLLAFTAAGLPFASAHILTGAIGLIAAYWLNASRLHSPADRRRLLRGVLVGVAGVLLRGGILAIGAGSPAAIVAAVLALAGLNLFGGVVYVFSAAGWRVVALALAGYSVLLRLVYLGAVDLLPEEAYYWSYAMHPSFGYLDHPPMVGWLIRIGRTLFGDTGLGVRFPALLCGGAAAWFAHRLACEMHGKSTGLMALVLFLVLPFFFATGFFMTPDAPLIASWSAAVYFLWRALVGGRRSAWWGVGLALGLGMLSKYTIALLVPAAALYMVIDPRARRWWRRPEPYLAGLLALLVFSPVIVWNARSGWASFAFQSVRRLQDPGQFGLHELLGAGIVMLTPLGAWALLRGLVPRRRRPALGARARRRRFVAAMTLAPLAVFVWYSLTHEPKMNWTAPIWLASLPLIAAACVRAGRTSTSRALALGWEVSLAGVVVALGILLHFMALGLPGVAYRLDNRMAVGWRQMSRRVADLEALLEQETGTRPVVVGMDHYFIAAEMGFYGAGEKREYTGSNLFGADSLMFGWWNSPRDYAGRQILLVAFHASELDLPRIDAHAAGLGPIQEHMVRRRGKLVTRFFTRTGRYMPGPGAPP